MATEGLHSGSTLGGRFRIRSQGTPRELGRVYVGWDTIESRAVHVLVLAPRFGASSQLQRQLARHQQAVAEVKHPSLVPFEVVGAERRHEAAGPVFLVRRFLEGQTLTSLLRETGRLEPQAAVGIAVEICRILGAAHHCGLVHGSLSPDNVFVHDGGPLSVTDAGLWPALCTEQGLPAGHASPSPWRPQEQMAGNAAHPTADVFTIGALLYYMLTGRPPFEPREPQSREPHQPVPLRQLEPRTPTWLAQVVLRTLSQEPSQRYRNANQLLQILRSGGQLHGKAARSRTVRQPAGAVAEPLTRKARKASRATLDKDGDIPSSWSYVPGTSLPALYEPDRPEAYRVRRQSTADAILVVLLIAAVLAVLGLIPLWWAVYQRWSASLDPQPALPYHHHQQSDGTLAGGDIGISDSVQLDTSTLLTRRESCPAPLPVPAVSAKGRVKRDPCSSARPVVHHGTGLLPGNLHVLARSFKTAEAIAPWELGA